MDELPDNEATAFNVIDNKWFLTKESVLLTKHGCANMQEMVIPGDVSIHESTACLYLDESDGKNVVVVDCSEHACANTRCLNDAGAVVEELTVRNYSSGIKHSPHNIWHAFFPDKMHNSNKLLIEIQNDTMNFSRLEDKEHALCNALDSPGVTRMKMLSQSGFSQYFVKNTLNYAKANLVDCNSAPNISNEITSRVSSVHEALSLREWLKSGRNKVDKLKSMYIFKQILDLIDSSHSRGEPLLALRPSCFKLMPLN
ncbi:hypothetical protein Hanom_Chr17g01527741 [Helianthus anomalus]